MAPAYVSAPKMQVNLSVCVWRWGGPRHLLMLDEVFVRRQKWCRMSPNGIFQRNQFHNLSATTQWHPPTRGCFVMMRLYAEQIRAHTSEKTNESLSWCHPRPLPAHIACSESVLNVHCAVPAKMRPFPTKSCTREPCSGGILQSHEHKMITDPG